jgi:DNA-binding FadR family transcriptional regulator
MNPQPYQPIKIEKPSDIIVKEIRKLIENGELNVGDKLPREDELVRRFQVSKVTLREALQTLVVYGQIEKRRGAKGGSVVINTNPSSGIELMFENLKLNHYSLQELHEARKIIEPILVEIVAQRITDKEIQELKKTVEEHENQIDRDTSTGAGWQFYTLLGKFSKNKILEKIEDLLLRILIDVENSFNLDVLQTQSKEHQKYNLAAAEGQKKIVELIATKQPEKAKQQMLEFRDQMHKLLLKHEKLVKEKR